MGIEPTLPKQVFYRHHGYLSASRPFWLLIYLLGNLLIPKSLHSFEVEAQDELFLTYRFILSHLLYLFARALGALESSGMMV